MVLSVRAAQLPGVSIAGFWALNLLNIADALLTHAALSSGVAMEANPVVRLIGLPGKVALVLLLSLVLSRIRPRALWGPVVPLAAVVAYSSFNLYLL